MPRKARDERLDTRAARLRLTPRREPYWRTLQEGRALGYRRLGGGKAGTWIARHYDPDEGRLYQSLGSADDVLDADGASTLTFGQAQERARAWFAQVEREAGRVMDPITVREALDAYVTAYQAGGGKAVATTRTTIKAHILPALGEVEVAKLTKRQLEAWKNQLAEAPARLRTAAKAKRRRVREASSDDERRARRATANRVMTVLKAALNLAFRDQRVLSDDAWRRVRPFPNVDAPRVRYLTDAEATRIVNACPADLRALVVAALLTGCRYGELARLLPADLDVDAGVLHVRKSKSGKARIVVLTAEAQRFFEGEAAGKAAGALVLPRADGSAWGTSYQHRPLRAACAAARIVPAASFHVLRHTHASRLAMKGVPMAVIAAQLGHASPTITAKHYAHLAPSYVADTVRAAFGELGFAPEPSVATLRPKVRRRA